MRISPDQVEAGAQGVYHHRSQDVPGCCHTRFLSGACSWNIRGLKTITFVRRYLRGVPFGWPLRLWRPWAVALGVLASVFYVLDSLNLRREEAAGCALTLVINQASPQPFTQL